VCVAYGTKNRRTSSTTLSGADMRATPRPLERKDITGGKSSECSPTRVLILVFFFFSFLKSQQETYVASRRIGLSTSTLWPGDVRRFSRNCKITSTSESKERYLNHGVRRERWKEVEDLR
jgi:hypothetical protein